MIRTRGVVGLLVTVWLLVTAALTAVQLGDPSGTRGDIAYLLAGSGAVGTLWLAALRWRGTARWVGVLLGLAITASWLGDLISLWIGWRTGAEPNASLADLGWLACYLWLGAGLLVLLRRGDRGQRRDIEGLIDVAAIFVAGMMIIWELAVVATLTDLSLPFGVRVLWGLYPVLDMAVLALVLRLLMRDRTIAGGLLAAGVGLWLAADFAYLSIADADSYSVLLDAAWVWGMVLVALAVVIGPAAPLSWRTPPPRAARDRAGLGRVAVALLPLLVPALIELQWFMRGSDHSPVVMVVGTVILVGLAFLRMGRLATAARAARRALASQERYASALAANSSDAVVVVDADLRLVNDFPRLAALIGLPADRMRGLDLLSLVQPAHIEETRAALRRCLASPGQVFYVELRTRGDHGRQVWLAARVVNLLDDPDVRGVVLNLHDISDRKRAEEELSHQAFHDALTGLANRALFRDRLSHALDRSSHTGTEPAVVFLDLDGFKTVNDSLGHDYGDDLLREVATRLTAAVRRGDTVGRLGGDEFAILIEQAGSPLTEATATADRVLLALREPVRLGGHRVTVSASLGIAVGDRATDPAGLLRDADVAMYRSKAAGKSRWTAYRPGMRTAALERLELENDLRQALDREQFRLAYQPIVELNSERVVGFEALLRWQHPDHGLLPPERFISIAEETGLIVPIGRWVLGEAAGVGARLRRTGPDAGLTMAVNLSARQLTAPDLITDVTEALAAAGLDPDRLVLEITETALVDDPAAAAARLEPLQRLGVRLAIDDFGTGYSSLSYLRHFPVDILKIDQSFVQAIPERGDFPAIVRGLLELGRTLRVQTLAEGVDAEYQRDRLREQPCDLAQGFLFAGPMPAAEAERFLHARRLAPTA